jgi:hypothetical protein
MRNVILFSAATMIAFFVTVESPPSRVLEIFEPAAPVEMLRIGLLSPELSAGDFGIL